MSRGRPVGPHLGGRSAGLGFEVHVAPSLPVVTTDFAPGEHERPWPPIPSTLVYGPHEAILVDSFITQRQAEEQADWVRAKKVRLTTFVATHGHGDHFFGASVLQARFPGVRFLAHPDAIPVMRLQVAPGFVASFWESRFPGQLPERLVVGEPLSTDHLDLDGERLTVIPLGYTDVEGTSCLHVPSLDLVAAGDAVYNGVHPRLVEAIQQRKLDEWLRALDRIDSLEPRVVVAGHKDPRNEDTPAAVEETREYILTLQRLGRTAGSRLGLYEKMRERYPDRLNRGALWSSVAAILP